LSACASSPEPAGPAQIDYRGNLPAARTASAPASRAALAPRSDAAPLAAAPLAAAPLAGEATPPGVNAVEEAKGLAPQAGPRPGGQLRQARDNPSARAIAVEPKDTLYDISRRYSVNMRALIETNGLEPPYALSPGDTVYLPPPNVHVVEKSETLYSVSRRYNVDTRSLASLNQMSRPWTVWPGDELLLPPLARDQAREVAKKAAPVAASAPIKAATPSAPTLAATAPARREVVAAPSLKPPVGSSAGAKAIDEDRPISLTPSPAERAQEVDPKPLLAPPPAMSKFTTPAVATGRDFIWPIAGKVLKGFGTGPDGTRNDGVNIAAARGAQVFAAAGGEVVYAGNELAGFGNLILLRHPGGWVTAYAHADALLVKEGDLVKQGQPIAAAGASGNAASSQVHFELRKGKEPVDPAQHMPPLRG
jgi:murein DD-endopeptidase MepM/ murein hydrolase activator NlpD